MNLANKNIQKISIFCLLSLAVSIGFAVSTGAQESPKALSEDYLASVGSITRFKIKEKVDDSYQRSSIEISAAMRQAWEQAKENKKVVMMVLGAEDCDRCQLLEKYMQDESLKPRIDNHFVVLNLGVGSFIDSGDFNIDTKHLPAIVLVESDTDYQGLLPTERMLTFMPEPYEVLYDWMESLLFYSDQVFSANAFRSVDSSDS